MQEFFTCLFSTNGLAYGTGLLIFLLTLFLASRRIIGFTLTLLFLLFALVAAFAVANKDLIRNYFETLSKKRVEAGRSPSSEESQERASFQEQLQKAYEDLKTEFEIQKKKFQSFVEEKKSSEEEKEQK